MKCERRPLLCGMLCICVSIAILVSFNLAFGRQGVDWDNVPNSPEEKQWYRELMQPDYPSVSCCAEADAYWADSFEIMGDQYVAIITDTRDDAMFGRTHIEPGTRIVVPNHKLKYDYGNPTGHGVIFVQYDTEGETFGVLCYIVPGGV